MQVPITPKRNRYVKGTRILGMVMLAVLLIQYLVGMYINLFVTSFAGENADVGIHISLGYILAVLAIITLVFAALARRINVLILSIIGLVAILVAGISGLGFLGSNATNDYYSLSMAIFFIVAIIVYGNLIQLVRRSKFTVK